MSRHVSWSLTTSSGQKAPGRFSFRGIQGQRDLFRQRSAQPLEKSGFDIALVDMNMPDKNGREFFGVCRKQYRKMQFMLMTGRPEFADAINIVKDGAFYYLLKPLDLNLLHSLILKAAHEKEKGAGTEGFDAGIIKNLGLKYRVVRSLGSGSSGVVLLVEKEKILGSFSDRVGRKTEYPISNTEYPTDEGKKRQIHSIVGEN